MKCMVSWKVRSAIWEGSRRWQPWESTVVTILNRVVSASLLEKVIFKQRLVRGEGGTIWILGVRASQAGE